MTVTIDPEKQNPNLDVRKYLANYLFNYGRKTRNHLISEKASNMKVIESKTKTKLQTITKENHLKEIGLCKEKKISKSISKEKLLIYLGIKKILHL